MAHTDELRIKALCYERLSYSKNGADEISPKRQREHNLRVCKANDWKPEIYGDTEGHKSGRFVKNRPGWQALEERLAGSDVVALVAYDLARLHRKGWRIGKLLEVLEENNVRLILSDPERRVDTSTAMGKIFIQFMAMADEYYAEDLAIRARGSIRARKAKCITVGLPPFGTIRNELGYLVARPDGAWLLEDGKLVGGRNAK